MTNSYMKESDSKTFYEVFYNLGYFLAVKMCYYNKNNNNVLHCLIVPPEDILLIPLEVLPGWNRALVKPVWHKMRTGQERFSFARIF